jgi:hypothetical protein
MEIIASQPGMKFYDEPVNIRRTNVQHTKLFTDWNDLMPDGGREKDIIRYLRDLQANRYRFMNPLPLRRHYRPLTNRIVFKIHSLEHMINDIKDACNGSVVFLLRHPIPTTLSRNVFPRLENFLASRVYRERYLSDAQMKEIQRINDSGTVLQKGVLSWCFENLVPLRHGDSKDWLFVTYEEALLNSEKLCDTMARRLNLPRPDLMLRSINTPAANITMSRRDTLDILRDPNEVQRRKNLVTKWKGKVVKEPDERACFDILDLFGIDAYRFGSFVAHQRYLHCNDTAQQVDTSVPTAAIA